MCVDTMSRRNELGEATVGAHQCRKGWKDVHRSTVKKITRIFMTFRLWPKFPGVGVPVLFYSLR